MRIDEALGESKPLAVKFGRGVLNVEYRPPNYTIEQMVAAQQDKDDPERLITMLQDIVVGWDLTRVEQWVNEVGETVEREIPVDITNRDDVFKYVPSPIIMGIVKAVREDNDVSGE